MNLALAPTTLTTGWSPIVLVTTPAQPASNARRMLLSDSVGGAEESKKGFSKSIPVKTTDRLADMADGLHSRHPDRWAMSWRFRARRACARKGHSRWTGGLYRQHNEALLPV